MTAPDLNFPDVLKRLSALPLKGVVKQCDAILAQLDIAIVARMKPEDVRLAVSLRGFLYFLTAGSFYTNTAKRDAPLYRPVIAALVQRGQLKKTFLDAVDRAIASALTQQLLRPEKQTPSEPLIPLHDDSNSIPNLTPPVTPPTDPAPPAD